MRYTRYADIPKFTRDGSWECDYDLTRVTAFIDEMVERDGLDLNPDFQRAHVWSEAQQIAWIEFFLRGGKTGRVLYLNHPTWQRESPSEYKDVVIVDGKQRLRAIRRFTDNDLKVFGSYRNEFTDLIRMHVSMRININTLQTRKEVLTWYLQMNAGGTPHTDEEINKVRVLLEAERTA